MKMPPAQVQKKHGEKALPFRTPSARVIQQHGGIDAFALERLLWLPSRDARLVFDPPRPLLECNLHPQSPRKSHDPAVT
ncbi:hypothetical protein AALO_G00208040 [Alosa alosa]|uniref:Uncharacterized protein n=1 Tax=Alosa alosa TaxID=278164 RepID=A0AAV6FZ14_9TELE|nr:hypothetical protein AALO_G00208040 [Alosa alosa]